MVIFKIYIFRMLCPNTLMMTATIESSQRELAGRILGYMEELGELKGVDAILDRILHQARNLTRADAGSIFLVEGDALRFSYVHNDTLFEPGATDKSLYDDFKVPINETSIVGFAAKTGETLVIDDAYRLRPELPYRFNPSYDERTGYRSTSLLTIPLRASQGKLVGVMQIINAKDDAKKSVPFDAESQRYLPILAQSAATAIERGIMTRELVLRMMKMAELRDPTETGAHVQRVGAYAAEIYKRWAKSRMARGQPIAIDAIEAATDSAEILRRTTDRLRLAAMLHDVGKVAIPDAILKKPGPLTHEEYQTMKLHTLCGARLFEDASSPLDSMCFEIALRHHEKWAGTGYPGDVPNLHVTQAAFPPLRGESIPLAARITGLADVYDALCSSRSYKECWPEDKVLQVIERESGDHFDPEIVAAFFEIHDVILAIRTRYRS